MRNTWAAMGILGNIEAGEIQPAIGILCNFKARQTALGTALATLEQLYRNSLTATGILGNFEAREAPLGTAVGNIWTAIGIHRAIGSFRNTF